MKKAKKKALVKRELKAVLETPLARLRIRKLQFWTQKPDKPDSSIPRPKTIGDFVRMFPYEVPNGRRIYGHEFRWVLQGLGSKTVTKMKRKLQRLGVTPDIWPALLHRKEFLGSLSKDAIRSIPVKIIFSHCSDWELKEYLRCKAPEQLAWKTMTDFFKVDPRKCPFFHAKHRHKLAQIRLLLEKRGFTKSDGAFFRWDPQAASLARARAKLKGRGLSNFYIGFLAKVAVEIGWE